MIIFLINAIKIIFLLGFLILIHEGGHFLVAKLCNIKVNEFSIGFGPKIWRKQGKETKYSIRLIPLGGYVSMEGEDQRKDTERSFSSASIPKRIAVVVAGATINIIFGLTIYFGYTACSGEHISNIVDTIYQQAENIAFQNGDKILKINNKKIRSKLDIDKIMQNANGDNLKVLVKRNNEIQELDVKPIELKVKVTGIYLATTKNKEEATKIMQIDKESNAEKYGLKVNDIIKQVNDIDVIGFPEKIVEQINTNREKIKFTILRDSEEINIELIPNEESKYYLGITLKQAENNFINNIYYGFWETGEFLKSIFDNLKMIFTGKVGVDQMVGPVGISNIVSKTESIKEYIYMLALVSLSLGVTNLLPIPALDGGKLLLLIIEAIRKKPLKEELELSIQMLGFAILISFSIFITYKDIINIF